MAKPLGWVKVMLVVVGCIAATWPELSSRLPDLYHAFVDERRPVAAVIFFAVWALVTALTVFVAFAAPTLVRAAYAVIFVLSVTFVSGYRLVMGESLEALQLERMLSAATFVGEAFAQYRTAIVDALTLSLPLAIGLIMPSKWPLSWPRLLTKQRAVSLLSSVSPIFAMVVVVTICWARGGEGTIGLPAHVRPVAYAAALWVDKANSSGRGRLAVTDDYVASTEIEDVVVVVDEGVVSDVFDEQSAVSVLNPLDAELRVHTVDLGPAASGANCSSASNQILRVGPRQSNVKTDMLAYPTIWEYAKHANFSTVYIDMQENGDILHNGMTEHEHQFIDTVITAPSMPVWKRDSYAGQVVATHMANGRREFIYVNKVGAHFPYDAKYPESATIHRPVTGIRGNEYLAHAAGQKELLSAARNGSPEFINSYRNAVQWNLSAFYAPLQSDLAWLKKTVLVYTSDHGQNVLREGGKTNTHCSSVENIASSEGRVPLWVISDAPGVRTRALYAQQENGGHLSHFNLFATVISAMGYDPSAVKQLRDPPVWDARVRQMDNLRLTTDVASRFGRDTRWFQLCDSGARYDSKGRCTGDSRGR